MVWTFNTSSRRINSPLREWGEAMGAGILHNAPIIAISPYDDSLTSNLHLHRRISAQAFGRPDGQPCPSVSLILERHRSEHLIWPDSQLGNAHLHPWRIFEGCDFQSCHHRWLTEQQQEKEARLLHPNFNHRSLPRNLKSFVRVIADRARLRSRPADAFSEVAMTDCPQLCNIMMRGPYRNPASCHCKGGTDHDGRAFWNYFTFNFRTYMASLGLEGAGHGRNSSTVSLT